MGIVKSKLGRVVSDKMQKTVVVTVENMLRHPIYRRLQRRTVRFKAHDEGNECKIGDVVRIMETRPLSKEKRWRVAEIVERADTVEAIDDAAV
jgi:small subunit ribosomal protein S17